MKSEQTKIQPLRVFGAYEHNLKTVDLELPKKQLCALTGVSGSGKSSLAFNTIYIESMRRLVDSLSIPVHLLGNHALTSAKRPKFKQISGLPPTLALAQKQGISSLLSTVGTTLGISDLLRVYFVAYGESFCRNCDIPLVSYERPMILNEITRRFADQNVTFLAVLAEKRKGAFAQELQKCLQLGFSQAHINGKTYDLNDQIPKLDHKKLNTIEIAVDKIKISSEKTKRIERAIANALDLGIGLLKISHEHKQTAFNIHSRCPQCGESANAIDPRIFSHSSLGKCETCLGTGASGEDLNPLIHPCATCNGSRLTNEMPLIKVGPFTYKDFLNWNLKQLSDWTGKEISKEFATGKKKILFELKSILDFILSLDLGHLDLNYPSNLLSPGDVQRLKLSSILASPLHSVSYILDEPCQGLSENEIKVMIKVLKSAIEKTHCSVLAVEHRPEFLKECDTVVTLGPGAGSQGGEVVSIESGFDAAKSERVHLKSLENKVPQNKNIPLNKTGAHFNDVKLNKWSFDHLFFPENQITLIQGPSGSGKTLLASELIVPLLKSVYSKEPLKNKSSTSQLQYKFTHEFSGRLKNVVEILPGTLKRSSRRTIASLLDILPSLRQIFSQLPSSQILGLTPSHFSWSTAAGRCPACQGTGVKEFHQKYGGKTAVECESCQGTRLNPLALQPRFNGKNFADIVSLTISEASQFLKNFRTISSKLEIPTKFGLGYLNLNQSLQQISGGEIQRLILSSHMNIVALRETWFVLFHPSTGLHLPDIYSLQTLISELHIKGATFVIIDNRQEMENFAHHRIELKRQ